jgi:hypothetical protein
VCQAIYIIIGLCVLLSSAETFTFFQLMLFTAPILIDIVCTNPGGLPMEIVRWGVGTIDAAIVVLSLLGLGGIVVLDADKVSFISTMLIFGGVSFSKEIVGGLLLVNLVVPVAYYHGSPCRPSSKTTTNHGKKGVAA